MIIFQCDKCDLRVSFKKEWHGYTNNPNDIFVKLCLSLEEQGQINKALPGMPGRSLLLCETHLQEYLRIVDAHEENKQSEIQKWLEEENQK